MTAIVLAAVILLLLWVRVSRQKQRRKDRELLIRDELFSKLSKNINEAFQRDRSSTGTGIQGTGLGMAITKRILNRMGGTIAVYTQQNQGAEFVVGLNLRLQSRQHRMEPIQELAAIPILAMTAMLSTRTEKTRRKAAWTVLSASPSIWTN